MKLITLGNVLEKDRISSITIDFVSGKISDCQIRLTDGLVFYMPVDAIKSFSLRFEKELTYL